MLVKFCYSRLQWQPARVCIFSFSASMSSTWSMPIHRRKVLLTQLWRLPMFFSSQMATACLMLVALFPAVSVAQGDAETNFRDFALTPPMGWNSWDIFGTTVTEKQTKEQADAMAEHLLPSGYDVLTVDIQWYEPNAKGHVYKPGARLEMDEYSRLIPAENRFPSSKDGRGFKPLADYVHSKGLRFGIHIMRGIPRQAVEQNTAVLGTDLRARDIAQTDSVCAWNPDMYGVDASTDGGRAYYDSIVKLYASWGVDYIKCDDISRPYDDVQKAEIEALRKAIDECGRPIVLSLSPGATPLDAGKHVVEHANLWRITDDFWDRWGLLHAMFERLDVWTPYRRPGNWPDADMIPFGIVEFNRPTKFTADEQRTLMSLWCIARSPLIFGGDMTKLDSTTLDVLTNPQVLEVNQYSTNNRQIARNDDLIVWAADVPDSQDRYVALFNAQSRFQSATFDSAGYTTPVISGQGNSVDISLPIGSDQKRLVLFVRDGGDGFENDHAAWMKPTLSGPKGKLGLETLEWVSASAEWGKPSVNKTCEGESLVVDGKRVLGIGTHSNSKIIYDLPPGYDRFTATAVLTNEGSVEFGVLLTDKEEESREKAKPVAVRFESLGIKSAARVRDLWSGEELGIYQQGFERVLPIHGSGLYRVSPMRGRTAEGSSLPPGQREAPHQ